MNIFRRFFRRLRGNQRPRRQRMQEYLESLRRTGMKIGTNVAIYNCTFDTNFPFLIEIGAGSIITHATILAHDASASVFGQGVVVGPVKIGERCFIGAGAIVLPGITIGDDCIVGAHAVVTRNISTGTVVAGNPARVVCATDSWKQRLHLLSGTRELIPYVCDELVPTEEQSIELVNLVRRRFS